MLAVKDQMRCAHCFGSFVARHLLAVPEQLGDLPLFNTVFVQISGLVVDDVQITIAQQANTQGLAVQLERH
nr:hypothetical protein [Pseudomonas sp. R37(2017)]